MIFVSGEQNIGFLKMTFLSFASSLKAIPSVPKSSPIKDFISKTPIGKLPLKTGSLENPSFDNL